MRKIFLAALFALGLNVNADAQVNSSTPPSQNFAYPTVTGSQYYALWNGTIIALAAAPTQNTARCAAFYAPGNVAQHIDQLSMTVTTLGTGPIDVAIYTDAIDSISHRHQPQTLIASGSFVVTSQTTVQVALGVAGVGVPISNGLNWVCANDSVAADAVRYTVYATYANPMPSTIGSATASQLTGASANITSLTISQTSGTWPSFVGATFTDSTGVLMPAFAVRVASMP